jgi:mannitol-1-phosphate/altronate dehydrogenase
MYGDRLLVNRNNDTIIADESDNGGHFSSILSCVSEGEQKEYVEKIITHISNLHLEDAVKRVGCTPLRKLSHKECFIRPASELTKQGKDVTALLNAAEMAFQFQNVLDDEESEDHEGEMPESHTASVRLQPGHPLFERVEKIMEKV